MVLILFMQLDSLEREPSLFQDRHNKMAPTGECDRKGLEQAVEQEE